MGNSLARYLGRETSVLRTFQREKPHVEEVATCAAALKRERRLFARMSTETPPSPEMAKTKSRHKKNKGNTDNETKKRKREDREEVQEAVPDAQPERPKKKSKKHKDHQASASKPVPSEEELLEQHSPFVQQTASFYLPLSPCAYNSPLEGLCAEHISPLLLTYFPPLNGVVISYEDPRMSEHPTDAVQAKSSKEAKAVLSQSINEYAVSYIWLTADFLTFRPKRGAYLEGHVGVQNESMLGLVCYNYFNAVIERDKLPKDWKWVEDEEQAELPTKRKRKKFGGGYFVDGDGRAVDGRLVFKVEDFEATPGSDTGTGTVSILGTLVSEREMT